MGWKQELVPLLFALSLRRALRPLSFAPRQMPEYSDNSSRGCLPWSPLFLPWRAQVTNTTPIQRDILGASAHVSEVFYARDAMQTT